MLQGHKTWNMTNSITYNHGRGNNWAMSYSTGCANQAAKPSGKKQKAEFDNFNIEHFDVFKENRAITEGVLEKV